MAILISLLLFFVLMLAIVYFGYRRYARPGRVYEQLGGEATFSTPMLGETVAADGMVVRVIQQLGEQVPIDPADASLLRRDLMAAGYRSEKSLFVYQAARVIAIVVLVVLALIFRNYITTNGILAIVIPIGAGMLGYFGPSLFLDHLVSARHERIRMALPDALDLMVVSVEAGLGLDQAIQYVAKELIVTHIDIAEELQLVNLEIRAGKRRVEALRNLAERTGEAELRKLVAILIQTERFGTSIADSLRTHSDFMRVRRRQEAEERANKVGVKLVFPIFFFILPAMLVVSAGPGLLQVFKYLFPLMRNANSGLAQ
ncbi:MAG: type secretion system protein [Bryobacterales bacterium]|nr:type secretion system protein [Bryobacterales bacterium]